jgi:anti-sigma factor RsiW
VNPCLSDDILCAYLDGATAPKDAIWVSEHMAECATCAVRLRELGQIVKLLGAALDAELSKDAPTERLRARFKAFLNEASAPFSPAKTVSPSLLNFVPGSAPRLLEWLGGSFRRLAFASVMVVSIAIVVALAIGAWRSGSLKTGSGEKATQAVNSPDSTNSQTQTPDQARGKPAIGEQATANNHQEHTVSARADRARPTHVNLENRALKAKPKESPLPSGEPGEPPYVASTVATGDRNVSVVLDVETAKHVEKAQSLFHSVINMPSSNGKTVLDVTYEKRLSRRLFISNTLLSRRAEIQGNWAAGELLSRLEPFLLDIANLPDKPSPNKVRLIKELMRGAVSSL